MGQSNRRRVLVQLDFWPELKNPSMAFYAGCARAEIPLSAKATKLRLSAVRPAVANLPSAPTKKVSS